MNDRAAAPAGRCKAAVGAMLLLPLALAGCSNATGAPLDEPQKLVRATLRILAAERPICVDNLTNGKPLAIFATMTVAPRPSKRELAWHAVTPLRPGQKLSNAQIYQDTIGGHQTRLPEPGNDPATLGFEAQRQLNASALALARTRQSSPVDLGDGLGVPNVRARWWPVNRLSRTCDDAFTLSDPVLARGIGYITVKSEHWGTTYALQPRGNDWTPVAQWNSWLF